MQVDEGCLIDIFYFKPIFNTCNSNSKVLLARGPCALNEGDIFGEMQEPGEQPSCEGATGCRKGNFKRSVAVVPMFPSGSSRNLSKYLTFSKPKVSLG